jgi:MinD-like ATPase involved in chromosome partitioning or flagellar assembly
LIAADIALAASAREWPDRLHRFLLDHGGGRIVATVMGADQAVEQRCDVLLIDDVCSFLNPHLVRTLKESGVEVIGVYEPEDGSDAKRHLLECGISDVIETAADPVEFLDKVGQTLTHRATPSVSERIASSTICIGVTGPSEGVGITEVAISLTRSISARAGAILVDLDPTWPSVAQRLDLPVHPNVRTALDHAIHNPDRLDEAVHRVEAFGFGVIGGRADGGRGQPISRHETLALTNALGAEYDVLVLDLGPYADVEPGVARDFDTMIVVGLSDPVGIGRLIRTAEMARSVNTSVLVVLNRVPNSRFQRSEALAEIRNTLAESRVAILPEDPRISQAAWNGGLGSGKPYQRALDSISDVVVRSLA